MLKLENLQVSYGGIQAVKGVSFDVPEGEIVTLIGANGAGKSTILRSVVGLVKPKSGSITFKGQEIIGMASNIIVEKGVTLVPEGRRVFPNLTVLENLKIGAYMRNDDLTEDLNWIYDLFPRLKERSWQFAGTL
ncbi:MAG: ATP-binding cassette domain-containing protein, partial [Oscillospiraceae bacterium]